MDGRPTDGRPNLSPEHIDNGAAADHVTARRAPGRPRIPSRPARLIPVPIAPEGPAIPVSRIQTALAALPAPLSPDFVPQPIRTRGTQRLLTALGLNTVEATGLVAYLVGLPAEKKPWTLDQINQLLFLREMYWGSWGRDECRPADPD